MNHPMPNPESIAGPDSPFRSLPATLSRRHVLYLDGLRISAEISGIALRRLRSLLVDISTSADRPVAHEPVLALADAWTTIDNVNRFRELLRSTPGVKHNAVFELFVRGTEIAETMRDAVQHLNNREINTLAEAGLAPLGTVT